MSDKDITEIIERGVAEVIVKEDLEKALKSGKKLKVKLGIDPTGFDLHIGHAVVLKKLKQFQDFGHEAILLIGDFTGKIGDPSGRTEGRVPLTDEEIRKNVATYIDQASKILDVSKLKVVYNADWLSKLTFKEVVELSHCFTVAQMMERDMYQERIKKNLPIGLHEFLYPLMQGYDSVELKADVEIGGTDQTFNLLAGREIQRHSGQKPQNVLTVPILEGLDGKEKMSKTYNNYIGIMESPKEMYGKTMSIPDNMIMRYFELCTDVPFEEINELKGKLESGENPRDLKMRLAREIVTLYHSDGDAEKAEEGFVKQFQKREVEDVAESITLKKGGKRNLLDLVSELCPDKSKSELRRLITQGGVEVAEKKVTAWDEEVEVPVGKVGSGLIVKVGKRSVFGVSGKQ